MKNRLTSRTAAVCGALTLSIVGFVATKATPASADTLLIESFQNSSVSDAAAWSSGGSGGATDDWAGGACLTAGTDTTQAPIPGCSTSALDSEGSGALRLTSNAGSRAGFALYNHALPTTGGLDITFDQAQYGAFNNNADGISFFLVDGSTNLTEPGTPGGGLGYSAGNTDDVYTAGIANGLLGIGIDKWGNFSAPTSSGTGCAAGNGVGSMGPEPTANVVAIRGPGNGTEGYCWLGASPDLGTMLHGDNSRAGATVHVHIVVDPAMVAERHVTVYLNDTKEIQIPAPQALLDATSFKFGFAGSTGYYTDVHEVWNLNINSVIPVPSTTTEAPSTEAPTTEVPTSEAPTSEVPTSEVPTTEVPTTSPAQSSSTTETVTTAPPSTVAPADAQPAQAVTAQPVYTG